MLKPGGRLAALEFGVPTSPFAFALWRLYTRVVMPLAGSSLLAEMARRERVPRTEHRALLSRAPAARSGALLARGRPRRRSLAAHEPRRWDRHERDEAARAGRERCAPRLRVLCDCDPAAGAITGRCSIRRTRRGICRTCCSARRSRLRPTRASCSGRCSRSGLRVGVAAHSFDELQGRPLGTRIPARVLIALGVLGLAGAAALGIAAIAILGPAFGALRRSGRRARPSICVRGSAGALGRWLRARVGSVPGAHRRIRDRRPTASGCRGRGGRGAAQPRAADPLDARARGPAAQPVRRGRDPLPGRIARDARRRGPHRGARGRAADPVARSSSRSRSGFCSRATSSAEAARGTAPRCGMRSPRPRQWAAARARRGSRARCRHTHPSARSR